MTQESKVTHLNSQCPHLGKVLYVESFGARKDVTDDTTKYYVHVESGASYVMIVSSPKNPSLISKAVANSNYLLGVLPETLAQSIIKPIATGAFAGCSFVLWPRVLEIPQRRYLVGAYRRVLSKDLMCWLLGVTESTRTTHDAVEITELRRRIEKFEDWIPASSEKKSLFPLAYSSFDFQRFEDVRVFSHGDLRLGNILLSSYATAISPKRWPFYVIDLSGGQTRGFPVFDFVCLAFSLNLKPKIARSYLDEYARILGCDYSSLSAYLLLYLAQLSTNLQGFPVDRFREMARQCLTYFCSIVNESRDLSSVQSIGTKRQHQNADAAPICSTRPPSS